MLSRLEMPALPDVILNASEGFFDGNLFYDIKIAGNGIS
jgi:hypothetical protein